MTNHFVTLSATRCDPLALDLVEEIGHRVVNEYSEAISGLSLAALRSTSAEVRCELDAAAGKLMRHAELHRMLLPPPTAPTLNLGDYLVRICEAFARSYLADLGVRLFVRTDDIGLASDQAWRIALIVAELIRNGCRHAATRPAGLIALEVSTRGDQLVCLVCNNGSPVSGRPAGRGQRLVRALAAELGGRAHWTFSPGGCLARVDLPLLPAWSEAPSLSSLPH